MLLVVFYVRKTINFYEKNLKHTKYDAFNNVLCKRSILTIVSYQFIENDWIFLNHFLFFRRKIFSTITPFQILKIGKQSSNIKVSFSKSFKLFSLKKMFFLQ